MWNKIYKWALSICIIGLIGFIIYIAIDINKGSETETNTGGKQTSNNLKDVAKDEENTTDRELIEISKEKEKENETADYVNPFGDTITKENLKESQYKKYINYMAHQKIYADNMFGFYEITPERINFLIDVLVAQNYENENVYQDILTRWKDGDFSQAVEDHNRVWRLQNGNVGKAQRLLSEEEEKAILKEYTQ